MDTINLTTVLQLITNNSEPCVSIYLPTHRAGKESLQNRVRFKNLLNDVERQLKLRGLNEVETHAMLKPARLLDARKDYWEQPREGMAAFCSAKGFVNYRLPVAFDECVQISRRPYIKPLLPLATGSGRFHLLVVSEKQVKLFAGNQAELTEVVLPALPVDLAATLHYVHSEGQHLVHTGQPAIAGKQGQVFYGQGGADRKKTEIESYFREIDRAVAPYLREHGDSLPLVFCGVEFLFPIYREVNTCPQLFDVPVTGNFEHVGSTQLLAKATEVLAPYWGAQQRRDTERLQDRIGSPLVSADIESLLPAAFSGQIEVIFVASDADFRGTYDVAENRLSSDEPMPDAEELLNVAAVETLTHGGRAYAVKGRDLPVGLVAAALYRF
ncbi:MAG TPA: hypothetical protein VL096_15900 [Pirellulaceae bacterium]|nr:hypothetical protein [Pirellulaceae bacterium]